MPALPQQMPLISSLAGLFCLFSESAPRSEEPPRPPTGEVRLESGRRVDYTVHFDRNSLQDSLRLGDSLIALTSSGVLLRFELPEVRLVRERIETEGISCLGRGENGEILAGLADGRVCRVDPTSLDLIEVTKLPAKPQWIGWCRAIGSRSAGLVVVTTSTKPVIVDGRRWDVPYCVINDLAAKKTYSTEEAASAFLLDREGRLWLGADNGEWGGRLSRVDLIKGTIEAIAPPPSREPDRKAFWQGVYGFIELRDGQVLAFGGSSHMGFNSGYIARIDGDQPRPLFDFEPPAELGAEPPPGRPRLPITQIVEEKDGLLVFSYSDVFRVDRPLKTWKKVTALQIQYRWGRPDAVGSYPSVHAISAPTREGEPYILSTAADGLVLLDAAKVTPRGLPGQLGAAGVYSVENSTEGTLFFEGDDRLDTWMLGGNGWEIASLAPPFEVDPDGNAAGLEKGDGRWFETRVLVGPGGTIHTVSGSGVTPGTRTTGKRVGGKSVSLGRETSTRDPSSSFITADGSLWNTSNSELARFENARWQSIAILPGEATYPRLTPIQTPVPPWFLLERFDQELWQLRPGAQADDPPLRRVAIQEGDKPLSATAAIPWTSGAILLATDAGLRTYEPGSGKLSKVELAGPLRPINALARDRLGRLWLGAEDGLWMAERDGKTAQSFDRVPMLRRNEVTALAPDPSHDDGMIVALGSRGVVFVRAREKP